MGVQYVWQAPRCVSVSACIYVSEDYISVNICFHADRWGGGGSSWDTQPLYSSEALEWCGGGGKSKEIS